MHPELFTLPVFGPVHTYGFCMLVAFLTAVWMNMKRAARVKADPEAVLNTAFIALIAGVAGSRIMYVAHYWDVRFAGQKNVLLAIIDIREGGLEFLGGFLGGLLATLVYLKIKRLSIRLYMDILLPGVAWGLAIGRLGCFFNGCCFGGACELPHDHRVAETAAEARYTWAVEFPFYSPAQMRQWEDRQVTVPAELMFTNRDVLEPRLVPQSILEMSPERREGPIQQARSLDEQLERARAADPESEETRQLEEQLEQAKEAVTRHAQETRLYLLRYAQQYPSREVPTRVSSVSELQDLSAKATSLPVHPTQLYSTINGLLLFGVLVTLFYVRRRHGVVLAAFMILYPVSRFLLELIRADNPHDVGALTISQFLGLSVCVVGLVYLFILFKYMPERSPLAVPFVPPVEEEKK